ncbi:MAG TPA: tetratricopeptide repeat protein [Thermoanaerobaculia bacterium]
MADKTDLRTLSGDRGGNRRKQESERLDQFLGMADASVLRSLREEESRRRRWMLAGALILGLLAGSGGTWMALRAQQETDPAAAASVQADARLLISQGEALMKAKELDRAWVYLQLAARLAPDLVDSWDALGVAHTYGGQLPEAERAMRRCLELDPGHARAYHVLGDLNFYSGNYQKARENWEKADARRALARLNLLENRFPEAAPLIRELERKTPDDPYIRIMREALNLGRLTPEMRRLLGRHYVLSRNPETAKGWRLFYAGRYTEAATTFTQALQKEPGDGSAMTGRGWCLLKLSSFREAQSYFDQVLATWPSSYSAMNGLAWSLKGLDQSEGALRMWERLLEMPHMTQIEIPESLKGVGMVYYERGDYARASSYLARSVAKNPYDPETRKLLEQATGKLVDQKDSKD